MEAKPLGNALLSLIYFNLTSPMINMKSDTYEKLSGKTSIGTELLLAALVFSLVIIYILVAPQYKQAKIVKEQIRLNQANIELKKSALEKIKNHNEASKEPEEKNLEKFKNLLQEKNNFESYLASINKIANTSESRVSLGDFSISESKPADLSEGNISGLQTVEISFTAKGDFENFMSFLNSLEKTVPLMNLDSLDLRNITEKDESKNETEAKPEEAIEASVLVESNIRMSFYYIDEELQAEQAAIESGK